MPMTLIQGNYRAVGSAPDGDSVKFYPRDKDDWQFVREGHAVRSNKSGGAQLRLDGIDALETHYAPQGGALGVTHQPLVLAHAASEEALKWLGFKDVERGKNEIVTKAKPEEIPGYILTRFADTYGRPVAFAFKGNHAGKSGDSVRLTEAVLKASLNHHMLEQGHAYPTYYSKLYYDIRRAMTKTVDEARQAKKGVWAKDKTVAGLSVGSLEQLEDGAWVVPKLYRRLMDYVALNGGDTSLDGFEDYLGQRNDRIYVLSEGQITGFDTVVKTQGQTVKLTKPPEDLVFQEK